MRTLETQQLVVTERPAWNKWPSTADSDFSSVLDTRWTERYLSMDGDTELLVHNRLYPIYSTYQATGAPLNVPYPQINNTVLPDQHVLDRQLEDLQRFSRDCQVVKWEHAYQCFPSVAKHLPELFKLSILVFGDDCPGSSDLKSFPIAGYFDVLWHMMFVWNYDTGERTDIKYKSLGVKYCKFTPCANADGLLTWVNETGFDVATKIAATSERLANPSLVFVGSIGQSNMSRRAFFHELAGFARQQLPVAGWRTRLYGCGMPDGFLEPQQHPHGKGYIVAPIYVDATFGVNFAESSIFNTRLLDLWTMGVAQLVHDPHNELAVNGIHANEHYISYDGTCTDLLRQLEWWRARPAELAALLIRAEQKGRDFTAQHTNPFRDIYFDHLDRLVDIVARLPDSVPEVAVRMQAWR